MFSAESHMKIICGSWWFHDRLNIWLSTCTSGYLPTSTLCVPSGIIYSMDWEDPLEKGMTTYSSILAWSIWWTEEPGRLQPLGSQRVRYHWATNTHTHTHTHTIETTQKHKVMTRPTKDSLSIQRIVFRLKKKEYMEWSTDMYSVKEPWKHYAHRKKQP